MSKNETAARAAATWRPASTRTRSPRRSATSRRGTAWARRPAF